MRWAISWKCFLLWVNYYQGTKGALSWLGHLILKLLNLNLFPVSGVSSKASFKQHFPKCNNPIHEGVCRMIYSEAPQQWSHVYSITAFFSSGSFLVWQLLRKALKHDSISSKDLQCWMKIKIMLFFLMFYLFLSQPLILATPLIIALK